MELFLGFYFGSLLMILLYNLHWYNVTKEKSYLYYFIYKGAMVFVILQATKIVFINQTFFNLSIAFMLILVLMFTRVFLVLKDDFKKSDMALKYIPYGIVLYFLYGTVVGDENMFDLPYSLLLSPLVVIAVLKYRRGYKPALYFVLAWGVSLLTSAVHELNMFEIAVIYPQIRFELVGHIVEGVISSYAIFEKTNLAIQQKDQQEQILIHQSKLASMGQMLENISHQWRQPLNRISTYIINMQVHIEQKQQDNDYLLEGLAQSQLQLEYMSDTINDFTNFNKQTKDKETFVASSVISDVSNIVRQTLEKNNISFEVNCKNDFSIHSFPNELGQVVLNLIQNAQDVLMSREIKQPFISIIIDHQKISIEDNAGGIEAEVIDKIFEPYVTTKSKSTSLGLGLYMSTIILEKYFDAKIEVDHIKQRTSFHILFEPQ